MATIINSKPFKLKFKNKTIKSLANKIFKIPSNLWYQQVKSSKHFNELQLQRLFLYKFQTLLPNHTAIYYDKIIVSKLSPHKKNKPDFLLWKNDYSEWYVIEVELEHHKTSEINTQLETFYNGDYSNTKSICDYVKSKCPGLDETKFISMIKGQRPKIMLMADHIQCEWREKFYSDYNCIFSTLQVYSDENDHFMYRISGDFPQEYNNFAFCNLNKRIQSLDLHGLNFLNNLGYSDQQIIEIFIQGEPDEWTYLYNSGSETLVYNGSGVSALDPMQNTWKLLVNSKNQLHLIK